MPSHLLLYNFIQYDLLLTTRLQGVINELVDRCQSAFVPGRSIADTIVQTHKVAKFYHQKGISQRCTLKLDMQKAYDLLDWYFMEQDNEFYSSLSSENHGSTGIIEELTWSLETSSIVRSLSSENHGSNEIIEELTWALDNSSIIRKAEEDVRDKYPFLFLVLDEYAQEQVQSELVSTEKVNSILIQPQFIIYFLMSKDGGKIPIPATHPSSEEIAMVNPPVSLNKDSDVNPSMSMPGTRFLLLVGAPGNTVVWPKLSYGHEPLIPRVTHSLAMQLRAQEAMKAELIQIEPPRITTKKGLPVVVFRSEDYKIKLA
ncbi:hypothetical protein FXO38_13282 [Capsicum annuum]|nr:hypothetical protein FXO38_13282 [Capsicum annuum]